MKKNTNEISEYYTSNICVPRLYAETNISTKIYMLSENVGRVAKESLVRILISISFRRSLLKFYRFRYIKHFDFFSESIIFYSITVTVPVAITNAT